MIEKHIRWAAARLLAFAVLPFAAGPLAAQEDAEPEPEATLRDSIVVSANRVATEAQEVGSSVSVITAEEIELRGGSTLADLLRTIPGLEVARGGGPGQVTSVFLRGGSSSHTLVLVDGVRVNAPATGAFDFADLATDLVDRVEIVRGPQSTLYGSEAMAGVISIITRRGGPGFRLSALAEAGELDHRRWRLGVDGGSGRFDVAAAVSDESTGGVSAAVVQPPAEDDPFDLASATARLGLALGDDGRIGLDLRAFDATVANDGFDFFAGPVDDLNRLQERRGLTASLRFQEQLGKRWNQTVVGGWNDDDLAGSDADDLFSNFAVDGRSVELSAQSDVALSANDTLSFGFSWEERQVVSAGSFDQSVDLRSVFVHHAGSVGDGLHLTAGLRHDDHSQFGGETTWRLSASWSVGREGRTRLHGTAGSGFKAPTLNDLFFPFFSNPGLSPETSRGFDLGVERALLGGRLTLDVTWFDTDFDDLIAFDFATFTPQNVAEAASAGVELTLGYRPGEGFQLAASHTWNETEDRGTGQPLARRPENRSTLELYFRPLERLRGAATLVAVRDRIDSDGSEMDDYERADLTLRWRASEAFEPYLRLENVFDEDYEEVNGFTTPGRVAVVGVGWKR